MDADLKDAEIKIRKAGKEDFSAVIRLLSTYFLDAEDLLPEDFVLAEQELIGQEQNEKELKVLGCAALVKSSSLGSSEGFLEIHSIAVHPNYRGKGIGTKLVRHLIREAAPKARELYVRTTAPLFFEKLGFAKIPDPEKQRLWEDCRRCEYFTGCRQTAMKLELSG